MITLLNKSGEFHLPPDGWYHLVKRGEFPVTLEVDPETKLNRFGTAHARAIQVIDEAAITAMAQAFAGEVLIDYDHASLKASGSTEAAGWVQNVEARADGLWKQTRWTDGGLGALQGGRFRYISPVWLPWHCEVLGERDGMLLIRPLRLFNAGLTNDPNLKGATALTNRANITPPPNNESMLQKTTTIAILAALGIPAEGVTDETVLSALPAIQNRLTEQESLQNRYNALLNVQVESDLARYAGVIANSSVSKWRDALLKDREGALALLGGITPPAPAVETKAQPPTPITNRATAHDPADTGAAALAQTEAKAAAIRNRASELRSLSPGKTVAQSYAEAEAELAG